MKNSLGVRIFFFFLRAKIVFESVDIIGLKKCRVNMGIIFVFYLILMNKGSFDSFKNFIWSYRRKILEILEISNKHFQALYLKEDKIVFI